MQLIGAQKGAVHGAGFHFDGGAADCTLTFRWHKVELGSQHG